MATTYMTFRMRHSNAAAICGAVNHSSQILQELFSLEHKILPHTDTNLNLCGQREDLLLWFQEEYVLLYSKVAELTDEEQSQCLTNVLTAIDRMRPLLAMSFKFSKQTMVCRNWDNARAHLAAELRRELENVIEDYNIDDPLLAPARQVIGLFLDLIVFQVPNDVYKVLPTSTFTKRNRKIATFNDLTIRPVWQQRLKASVEQLRAAMGRYARVMLKGYQSHCGWVPNEPLLE